VNYGAQGGCLVQNVTWICLGRYPYQGKQEEEEEEEEEEEAILLRK
jgi:hypothetical protein